MKQKKTFIILGIIGLILLLCWIAVFALVSTLATAGPAIAQGSKVEVWGAPDVTAFPEASVVFELRLPSGEVRRVSVRCLATIGQVGNAEWSSVEFGKAGRKRWMGIRPTVRGVAMNPVDHPMGGGEGRTSGGGHPVSPWGQLTKGKKTRHKRKTSGKFIVSRRK